MKDKTLPCTVRRSRSGTRRRQSDEPIAGGCSHCLPIADYLTMITVPVSMGTGNGNTDGQPYTALYPSANGRGYAQYINLGGNDPDGWPVYNGLIGDTYVYDVQLTGAALLAVQDQVWVDMGLGTSDTPGTLIYAQYIKK
jgi:hypothetical protein